jgi:Na+/melibiose symporter-like transporter
VFLLPSLLLGVVFALLLGGRPSRLLEVEIRRRWAVWLALAVQISLFAPSGVYVPPVVQSAIHLASYGFLFLFALANLRLLALMPVLAGMALNAVAIALNDGKMPVSPEAWKAAGLTADQDSNVRLGAEHVGYLGDVFALPSAFPLTNVFSVGDLLIGIGMVAFIVTVSTSGGGERTLSAGRLLRPLALPAFRRLAVGRLVSHLGDWLTLAALVGWLYEATGSTTHVALLLLVRLAPPILGGGVAVAVVDRLHKPRLLMWVEVLRGIVVAGALAAVVADSYPLALVAVGVSGMLAAVSSATVPALVPSLLGREQLPAANAGLGIAQDAAMALGALSAGIALAAADVVVALIVDLATFVVAAILFSGIAGRTAGSAKEAGGGFIEGLRYLVRNRPVLVVVGAFGTATLATGLTNATLPRFLDEQLGLGSGGYGFGLAALACGLALGQAFVGLTRAGPGAGRWIGAGLLVMAALFVTLGFTAHAATALLLLALIGFVDGTTDVLFETVVQRESDPRYYGRVFGFASVFMTTTMMSAVAAAPLINRLAMAQEVILFAGLALVAGSAIALFGTRSRRVEVRDEEDGLTEDLQGEEARPLAEVVRLVPRPESSARAASGELGPAAGERA